MINQFVNNIANRLSLRHPQRESLEILDRICELLPIKGQTNKETSLAAIRNEFSNVTNFERDFPSLCFALATGVGKTRLMGAFISYLNQAHGIKNFFVLAPNLTIYKKLITDFTPNTSKYVFTGISEFAIAPPDIITGDNYEMRARTILDEQIGNVLRFRQNEIANSVHTQMQKHFWEETSGYEVKISKGFTTLKDSAYTRNANDSCLDYRYSPPDKSNISKYLFTGFSKCLYQEQKFQSEAERVLSIILERDAIKWFKPARGQFQLYYKWEGNYLEYQPDFVAEAEEIIYMLEPKNRDEIEDPQVLAKKDVAVEWCQNASDYMLQHNGKPWVYVLIPHDAIAQNMTLKGLGDRFRTRGFSHEIRSR